MAAAIEFKLFAPNNKAATLLGSFSQWAEIPLEKDDKGYFRTNIKLEDGKYQYKFRVQSQSPCFEPDEWVEVNDPYATEIDRTTDTSTVRIKAGARIIDTYVWQHGDKELPNNEELVVYEMHVADFSESDGSDSCSKFQQVKEKLDYLCDLGINAIELMPVNEYPGDYSWGYKVRDFFAVESSYGTTADLKQLIDECHGRGIRVILDGIYNHCDEECPLLLIDRNYWYYRDKHYPEDPANYWGPEFNYENFDPKLDIRPAWKFIGDVVNFWIQEYHIDGIRYDAVRQLDNRDFLHWITREAKKTAGNKPFYNIAEHIPELPELVAADGPMDGCWHESFRIFAIENLAGKTFDIEKLKQVLEPKQQGYQNTTNAINYLASHDRDHLLAEASFRDIDPEAAFKRAKLGAVLLVTAVGIPMLWMGEEFGQSTGQTPNQPNKLQWSLLKTQPNHELLEYYKQVIRLRKKVPALYTENIEFIHENPEAKVLAYYRWSDEGTRAVVVANFSDTYLSDYCIPKFPAAGTWHEWRYNKIVEVGEEGFKFDLPEWSAQVFV
ncbi:alpha-amylase family glycosyl hydrolase [Microcoleus sp. Pol14C2]|uniref:alpha-amylase family glycosyl hydrolase n=1 Tax=unclassified Microcoleus TaxID=2642155 RepID=UPI002FD52BFF